MGQHRKETFFKLNGDSLDCCLSLLLFPRVPHLVASDGQQYVFLGNPEPRAEHRFEVGLEPVGAEASHLPGARHLYPEQHVCARQPRVRKHRHLHVSGKLLCRVH